MTKPEQIESYLLARLDHNIEAAFDGAQKEFGGLRWKAVSGGYNVEVWDRRFCRLYEMFFLKITPQKTQAGKKYNHPARAVFS